MQPERTITWVQIKKEFFDILLFLKEYAQNPLQKMKQVPDWNWEMILILQTGFAALCGILAGVVSRNFAQIIAGLILLPISSTVITFIVAGFFYYTFLFFLRETVPYKKIFSVIVFANLPFMVLYILLPLVKPIGVIGLGLSSILLIVGFVENFRLPKKPIVKIVSSIYLIYLLLWVVNMIESTRKEIQFHNQASPESLDILEKELKDSN